MEFKNDISTKEDRDFIVDDEDPTYEPKDSSSSDDKYVVTGKEFKKLSGVGNIQLPGKLLPFQSFFHRF